VLAGYGANIVDRLPMSGGPIRARVAALPFKPDHRRTDVTTL
jgi:hypothetical protein